MWIWYAEGPNTSCNFSDEIFEETGLPIQFDSSKNEQGSFMDEPVQ